MSEQKQPRSGKDVMSRAKPKMRRASCDIVMDPSLIDEYQREHAILQRAVANTPVDDDSDETRTGSSRRLAEPRGDDYVDPVEQAEKVAALEERILASTVKFTFEGMPVFDFKPLTDNHPPRPDDKLDLFAGYNRDAVLDEMVRKCLIDPVFEDCADMDDTPDDCDHEDCGSWQAFIKVCNPGEWNELRDTVNEASEGVLESPKSALVSRILARRATT